MQGSCLHFEGYDYSLAKSKQQLMQILLAGPGTGKTTSIKKIIAEKYSDAKNVKVISFTNATVNDLKESFSNSENVSCVTLHSLALQLNHIPNVQIINKEEEIILTQLSNKIQIAYDEICEILNCISFINMIRHCVSFIKVNPAYITEKLGNIDLLIVDEYQDFNPLEQELVTLISKLSSQTIILGDDDQSIYDFKDADPDGIISIYNDSSVDKISHDNMCYRCPDVIVDFCLKLLLKNKHRIQKEWKKSNKEGKLVIEQFVKQTDCDNYIFNSIADIKQKDKNGTILVLSPVGFAVTSLIEKLVENNIQHVNFWDNKIEQEDRINIWWLNVFFNKKKVSYLIFLLKSFNQFGKKKILALLKTYFQAGLNDKDFITSLAALFNNQPYSSYLLSPPTFNQLCNEYNKFEKYRKFIDERNLGDSISDLLKNFKPQIEFDKEKVNVMSIHKSKGLQADYVIINGLVSGILPNELKGTDTIEAQRRLLFVGLTRAKKELLLTSTIEWDGKYVNKVDKSQFEFKFMTRKWRGKTSKFIQEII